MILLSCNNNHYQLANTKWLVKTLAIDSTNYLSESEKIIYSKYDTSIKLHMQLNDTLAFTHADGKVVDTCKYKIIKDTLFFIYNEHARDTAIIIKLTKDSFITRSLSGIIQHSVRE